MSAAAAQDIEARVLATLVEVIGKKQVMLAPDQRLLEDLKIDSLDTLHIVMALEKDFATEIPDEDLAGFRTIGDIQTYIRNRHAGRT